MFSKPRVSHMTTRPHGSSALRFHWISRLDQSIRSTEKSGHMRFTRRDHAIKLSTPLYLSFKNIIDDELDHSSVTWIITQLLPLDQSDSASVDNAHCDDYQNAFGIGDDAPDSRKGQRAPNCGGDRNRMGRGRTSRPWPTWAASWSGSSCLSRAAQWPGHLAGRWWILGRWSLCDWNCVHFMIVENHLLIQWLSRSGPAGTESSELRRSMNSDT